VVFVVAFLTAAVAAGVVWLIGLQGLGETAGTNSTALRLAGAEPPLLLREQLLSSISVWQQLLVRFDFVAVLKVRILEAGLKWSVGRVTLTMLLLGSVSAVILLAAEPLPAAGALVASLVAALIPYFYILHRRNKRFQNIEEQFPDALDSLSRALRAGQSFGPGMELVADESPEPLAQEIRRACHEWKLGLTWDSALENFARRAPLLEIRLFVAAVVLHGRFGGNLNQILEDLAKSIRDSIALRGDVRSISAQGRISGTVLTILPIAIAGIMLVTSPLYIGVLFHYPTGKYLIAAALICLALGHLSIRRIVNIKV